MSVFFAGLGKFSWPSKASVYKEMAPPSGTTQPGVGARRDSCESHSALGAVGLTGGAGPAAGAGQTQAPRAEPGPGAGLERSHRGGLLEPCLGWSRQLRVQPSDLSLNLLPFLFCKPDLEIECGKAVFAAGLPPWLIL